MKLAYITYSSLSGYKFLKVEAVIKRHLKNLGINHALRLRFVIICIGKKIDPDLHIFSFREALRKKQMILS